MLLKDCMSKSIWNWNAIVSAYKKKHDKFISCTVLQLRCI